MFEWIYSPEAWIALVTLTSLEIVLGISRGVAALHRAGITHRDLKSQNVMIDADGTLQVRAQDVGTGQQQQISIKLIGELPEDEIDLSMHDD